MTEIEIKALSNLLSVWHEALRCLWWKQLLFIGEILTATYFCSFKGLFMKGLYNSKIFFPSDRERKQAIWEVSLEQNSVIIYYSWYLSSEKHKKDGKRCHHSVAARIMVKNKKFDFSSFFGKQKTPFTNTASIGWSDSTI